MLKAIRSAAKKTKIIALLKHLPWHSRLFLGSKCASLELLLLIVSKVFTTVFNFTRPLGVFHQKKIMFRLPSIIDTIYGNVWGEPALRVTVFSGYSKTKH